MINIFILFVVIEILIFVLIKLGKSVFQWIIDYSSEKPKINLNKLDSFLTNSYDPDLGWIRKPNSKGEENSYSNNSSFSIDEKGSRFNPFIKNSLYEYDIHTYGDSFTFCRQVNNHETWQYYLSKKIGLNVSNFGVGNYGIDQAFLLYKRHIENNNKIIVFGIVPETILRIHSFWKHYLEYGNTLAFKPRFEIINDDIQLVKNPVISNKDYQNYINHLAFIQKKDFFYKNKFKKNILKFPYIFYLFKNPKRNFSLLISCLIIFFFRNYQISQNLYRYIFKKFVIDENTKLSYSFYNDTKKNKLLKKIIYKINENANKRNSKFILLVLPQLTDLHFIKKNNKFYYKNFFKQISEDISVLDLTTDFLNINNFESLYVNDKYGGHLNSKGNKLVSELLNKHLKKY